MDKETIKSILLAHGFTIKPGETDLKPYVYKAASELLELAAPDVQGEPVAWIRRWSLDGEKPSKERNKNGRMALPMRFKLHEVTRNRCLPDDVALYTAPQPAEQQPALDVSALVEALELAHMALIGYLPSHRNDITDAAISHCEQALTAHRKGGDI